jgi:hypothetical protein
MLTDCVFGRNTVLYLKICPEGCKGSVKARGRRFNPRIDFVCFRSRRFLIVALASSARAFVFSLWAAALQDIKAVYVGWGSDSAMAACPR